MADDLVKRLRDKHCCDATKCNCDEAADVIEKLQSLLDGRDEFIVAKGLWHDFVSTLPLKTKPIMRDGRIVGYVADFKALARREV